MYGLCVLCIEALGCDMTLSSTFLACCVVHRTELKWLHTYVMLQVIHELIEERNKYAHKHMSIYICVHTRTHAHSLPLTHTHSPELLGFRLLSSVSASNPFGSRSVPSDWLQYFIDREIRDLPSGRFSSILIT